MSQSLPVVITHYPLPIPDNRNPENVLFILFLLIFLYFELIPESFDGMRWMAKVRVCQNTLRTVKEAWEKLRAHDDKENSKLLEYFFILLTECY